MDGGDAQFFEPVTERVIAFAIWVADAVGHGVCDNAVAYGMRKSALGVMLQRGIVVFYDDVIVGE